MEPVEYFTQKGYSCAESVIQGAIDKGIVPAELLPVATSFSGGMGSGCLCGAISASQVIIGYLFGRNNKQGNDVTARIKAKEFIDEFKKNHKATCCRVLTAGMDMASPERKAHCANMVDECSKILEEIIKVKV
jgi:C_GCAxxG_C_C family probable redox protein